MAVKTFPAPPWLVSEPRGPAQIRPHSWHLLIILSSVVPDWARGRGMSARRKSWSALSRQLALLFPPGRAGYPQLRLATPRPPPPAIIGRREAGSPELHPGKCSPIFSPGGRSSEESRDCTLSLGHVSPAASPTLPLGMDRQDTSAGDFLHWDLHRPLATFSGTVSSGACGFSVLSGQQPDPSPRLCWGSRSGR